MFLLQINQCFIEYIDCNPWRGQNSLLKCNDNYYTYYFRW